MIRSTEPCYGGLKKGGAMAKIVTDRDIKSYVKKLLGEESKKDIDHWAESLPIQSMHQELRELYPNGHPEFTTLILNELELHDSKNHDYSCGGDPLGNFKRVADMLAHYPGLRLDSPAVIGLVFAFKQIDAVLWMLSNGHQAKMEGVSDRLRDISIYMKLVNILLDENEKP